MVTGGGGFLGGAVVRRLLARGHEVRVLSRGEYPELAKAGAECLRGDVADAAAVRRAADGAQVVFHVAAKVGLWGRYEDYYAANVTGTKNVAAACEDSGARLVFTGSPSVVFDGRDCEGVDEAAPYPRRFDGHYSRTKALAEELVLSAASAGRLRAVSLRPHLVWGPGDNHIIWRLLEQSKAGTLRRIAGFNKRVDTTYVDDAAQAHLLAAERLEACPSISGRAYFLSQGDARPLWFIINGLLAAAGRPPVEGEVPLPVARAAACAYEAAWTLLGRTTEPPLTRFVVTNLTTAHWFDISAARRDLGYNPSVTIEEGLARLADWLKGAKAPAPAR